VERELLAPQRKKTQNTNGGSLLLNMLVNIQNAEV